jgi:hypothetical protein
VDIYTGLVDRSVEGKLLKSAPPPVPTNYASHSLFLSLDEEHGRCILLPAIDQIVHRGEQDHAAEHETAPVHRAGDDGRGQREEDEDEERAEEAEGGDVDGHAEAAEGPAARGQRLPADTLQEHA